MIQIKKEGHLCEAACTARKPLHGPSFSFMDVAVVHLSKFIWKQQVGLYVTCKRVRKHTLHKYHPNFDTQVVDPIQSCSKTYSYPVQSFPRATFFMSSSGHDASTLSTPDYASCFQPLLPFTLHRLHCDCGKASPANRNEKCLMRNFSKGIEPVFDLVDICF